MTSFRVVVRVITVCVNQVFFSAESAGYEPEERSLMTTAPSHETTTRKLVLTPGMSKKEQQAGLSNKVLQ
jgi:hypothetical protein